MRRSTKRTATLKVVKPPFALLKDEKVSTASVVRLTKSPRRQNKDKDSNYRPPKHIASPRPKGKTGNLASQIFGGSILPQRDQFLRLDSAQSFTTLAGVSVVSISETFKPETTPKPETQPESNNNVKKPRTLEQFLQHSRTSDQQKSSPALFSPFTFSTIKVRKGKTKLPLIPLPFSDEKNGLKKEYDVNCAKKHMCISLETSSNTHAVYAQLRFEECKATVEFVRVLMVFSSSSRTSKESKKAKKTSVAKPPQLRGPSSRSGGPHSLEDLEVQFVHVPIMSSAA